jgi:hypothetical protein
MARGFSRPHSGQGSGSLYCEIGLKALNAPCSSQR